MPTSVDLTALLATSWPIWPAVGDPWQAVDLTDWRFWLHRFVLARTLILYFIPLAILLFLTPARHRSLAIIAGGLLFLAYLFGVLHALFFLLSCVAFFHLAERFAIESRRTDVLPWGPPLAAILVVSLWYLLSQKLGELRLPANWTMWLHAHLPWLYPLGLRGFAWEPAWHDPSKPLSPFAAFDDRYPQIGGAHLIGTAYLALRMLHYFSEIRRDGIPRQRRNLRDFLTWLCFGPTLMQGPIQRCEPFHKQLALWDARRQPREMFYGIWRVVVGVLKALLAHVYLLPIVMTYFVPHWTNGRLDWPYYRRPESIESYWLLYCGVPLHFAWLYLEFSGYCDVAIGMSRILGNKLPENFDWVWISRSLREFWRRWHITLSFALRDYIYIPLGGNKAPLRNLVLTFVICGLWHKWIPPLWQWGILMGVLVWVNQKWVEYVKRLEGGAGVPARANSGADHLRIGTRAGSMNPLDRSVAALRRHWLRLAPLPQLCAWLLTMHAFFLSILVFFGGAEAWVVLREIIARPMAYFLR